MSAPQVSRSKAKSKPNSTPKSPQSEVTIAFAQLELEPNPTRPEPATTGLPTKAKPTSKPKPKPKPKPKANPKPKAKPQPEPNSWSMYPSRHAEVLHLLDEVHLEPGFYTEDDDNGADFKYVTNITGGFKCLNTACKKRGWSSQCVPVTIRFYEPSRYNARVYHQRCKSCNHLAMPELNTSYEERVAYRIKYWCGIQVERPDYSGQSQGPHQSELCEGCRHNCSRYYEVRSPQRKEMKKEKRNIAMAHNQENPVSHSC